MSILADLELWRFAIELVMFHTNNLLLLFINLFLSFIF